MKLASARVDVPIMKLSKVTVNTGEDVAGSVARSLKVELTDGGVSIRPQRSQKRRGVYEGVRWSALPEYLVRERDIEKARMKVRATELLAILAAHVKPDDLVAVSEAKALHEELKVPVSKGSTGRKRGLVVGERDEAVFRVEACLVHDTKCPRPRAVETAADALATWNRDGLAVMSGRRFERDAAVEAKPRQRPEARHRA